MLSWIFGTKTHSLVLKPDISALSLPGFKEGDSLTLTANDGDTVGIVMDRFNTYRGPNSQISVLWTPDGVHLPYTTPVNGVIIAIVKKNE